MHKTLICLLLLMVSCSKSNLIEPVDTVPPYVSIIETSNRPKEDPFMSCGGKIAMYGDSFTEAWNEHGYMKPPLYFVAEMMGIDTMRYHVDGTGWHWTKYKGDTLFHSDGIGGTTSTQILKRAIADSAARLGWFKVWMMGRNDASYPDVVVENIRRAIAMSPDERYIIIGVLHGNWVSEWVGTEPWNRIKKMNQRIKDLSPKHFIDPNEELAEYADMNSNDTIAIRNRVTPFSLTIDGDSLHLKERGARLIGQSIFNRFSKCN